jgi:hypothetical protein
LSNNASWRNSPSNEKNHTWGHPTRRSPSSISLHSFRSTKLSLLHKKLSFGERWYSYRHLRQPVCWVITACCLLQPQSEWVHSVWGKWTLASPGKC